jgi:hypothetical protein
MMYVAYGTVRSGSLLDCDRVCSSLRTRWRQIRAVLCHSELLAAMTLLASRLLPLTRQMARGQYEQHRADQIETGTRQNGITQRFAAIAYREVIR